MTWDYIAGFFDGEGSINHNGSGFRITISQTNKEVLDKIKKFTKTGNVFKVTKRKEHWKDSWVYFISKQVNVYYFLSKIENYTIVKREKTNKTILLLKDILVKQKEKQDRHFFITQESKKLRKQGLSYREIGKKLKIDWGYARHLTLK